VQSPLEALYERAGALHRAMAVGRMGVHAFVDAKAIVHGAVDDEVDEDDDEPMSANEYAIGE